MRFRLLEEVDSNNKELSPEQSEFFKNSLIRDDNGNLLVCYHGSPVKGIDEFNQVINWFTPMIEYATKMSLTGNKYTVYLNCNKIFECGNTDGYVFSVKPEGRDTKFSMAFTKILSNLNIDDTYFRNKFKEELTNHAIKIFSLVRTGKFGLLVKRCGYDCIHAIEEGYDSFGVLDANKIKGVNNLNPTNNKNINK